MKPCYDLIGSIDYNSIICLQKFIESQTEPIECLTLNISSIGGSLTAGVTGYNYLKSRSFPITTHNLGEVTSAAVLLYLAGKIRTSEKIAKFMIHPIEMNINGSLPYHKVEEILKGMDADIKNYAQIIIQETNSLNGNFNVEESLRTDSIVFDAKEALLCGIVTQ